MGNYQTSKGAQGQTQSTFEMNPVLKTTGIDMAFAGPWMSSGDTNPDTNPMNEYVSRIGGMVPYVGKGFKSAFDKSTQPVPTVSNFLKKNQYGGFNG